MDNREKYNKIFDQLSYDLCEKTEADGTKIYTPDNFNKWMDRVIDMPEYRIIGIRHFFFMLKEKIKDVHKELAKYLEDEGYRIRHKPYFAMPGYTHSKWTVDTDKKEALDAAKEDLESITAEDFLKTF